MILEMLQRGNTAIYFGVNSCMCICLHLPLLPLLLFLEDVFCAHATCFVIKYGPRNFVLSNLLYLCDAPVNLLFLLCVPCDS